MIFLTMLGLEVIWDYEALDDKILILYTMQVPTWSPQVLAAVPDAA